MKKKLFRKYHSFYTPYRNTLNQGQSSKDIHMRLPPLNKAPDFNDCPYLENCRQEKREICSGRYDRCTIYYKLKILSKLKVKTGLERFMEKYPDYKRMFVGSRE